MYVFFYFIGWIKLSQKYKVDKNSFDTLFLIQSNAFINNISLKGLNIGVSGKGLFLSFSSPVDYIFSSLLIPWEEISYGKSNNSNYKFEYLIFDLGNPKVTQILISSHTIKKIHQNYGKPIFFEQLGKPK